MEAGADIALAEEPVDSTAMPEWPQREQTAKEPATKAALANPENSPVSAQKSSSSPARDKSRNALPHSSQQAHAPMPVGTPEACAEALALAKAADSIEALREAISGFDKIGIRKTATNLVFADGNPSAKIMLVGEAPGGDEDRQGKPFVGVSGQLLDRMMKWIGLDRTSEDPQESLYVAHLVNWRPPGNRTPHQTEIDMSLPFIEKHIALVKPDFLIFCGSVAAKALLARSEGLSKLRGKFYDYTPVTEGLFETQPATIPALATYDPTYLLHTPAQKSLVWQDLLLLQKKRRENQSA